jgi:hypothetical protein
MLDFRTKAPQPTEPDEFTKVDAFVSHLESEMSEAATRFPKGDFLSVQVQHFLTTIHEEIHWTEPHKKRGAGVMEGKEKDSGGSGSGGQLVADSKSQPKTATQLRNERKRNKNKREREHDGSEQKKGGTGKQGGGNGAGVYGPQPICIAHLLGLLDMKHANRNTPVSCLKDGKETTSCPNGYHPRFLNEVDAEEARKIIAQECWGDYLGLALTAHGAALKANRFKT